MVSRSQAIQGFLNLYQEPAYLEVGVNQGVTFNALKAAKKVAVDPHFRFDWKSKKEHGVEYYEVPSDSYFGEIIKPTDRFDVIYLDGLHTFEQTLRDLINAVIFLKDDGVILIDDIVPTSYHASLPDFRTAKAVKDFLKDPDGSWMGDVYKLAFFIETFFQQFSYATIEENHGQLVMWRSRRPSVVQQSVGSIAQLQFSDVVIQRGKFCIRPFSSIVEDVKKSQLYRTQ